MRKPDVRAVRAMAMPFAYLATMCAVALVVLDPVAAACLAAAFWCAAGQLTFRWDGTGAVRGLRLAAPWAGCMALAWLGSQLLATAAVSAFGPAGDVSVAKDAGLGLLLAAALAPVAEELCCRRLCLGGLLSTGMPALAACAVSTLAFALMHTGAASQLGALVGGWALACCFAGEGRLAPCVALHGAYNLASALLGGVGVPAWAASWPVALAVCAVACAWAWGLSRERLCKRALKGVSVAVGEEEPDPGSGDAPAPLGLDGPGR